MGLSAMAFQIDGSLCHRHLACDADKLVTFAAILVCTMLGNAHYGFFDFVMRQTKAAIGSQCAQQAVISAVNIPECPSINTMATKAI